MTPPAGFDRLGLKAALSAQRSNGLFSMVEAHPPRRAEAARAQRL